jgi:hypothetical protein
LCYEEYTGLACDEVISPSSAVTKEISNPWRFEGVGAFTSSLSRAGHTMVLCGEQVYVFGGYSLSHGDLNDLFVYEFGEWALLYPTTADRPEPRYHHAAVCLPHLRALYIYGGITNRLGADNDVWKYNLDANRWTQLHPIVLGDVEVPLVAGHTMTPVAEAKVVIIGGFSSETYYSQEVYLLDASTAELSVIETTGAQPIGRNNFGLVHNKCCF